MDGYDIERYFRGWEEMARRGEESRRARENRARGLIPALVDHLVHQYGARRVILFGSLAEGFFGPRSDIDLAVEGIEGIGLYRAGAELDDIASPIRVDLVPIEDTYEETRRKIELTGKVIHG